MTRGVRTTLVLFIVLGALVAFVAYTNNAQKAAATPAPTNYVWELTTPDVSAVEIVDNAAQKGVALAKDPAGIWQITSPVAEAADPAQGDQAASFVSTMYVRRTLTETTELGEYGLLTPLYTLSVTKTDGTKVSLGIGLKTPTGDGYYVLRPGDTNPLIVSSSTIDSLIGYIAKPPVKPTEPPQETPAAGTPGPGTTTPKP